MADDGPGAAPLHSFASRLYPICRSITGSGVRRTLQLVRERIPLVVTEVRSGSSIFDWKVPLEWNIEAAHVTDPRGNRIVDFADHNLHVVSYSAPMDCEMSLEGLLPHLHTRPDRPDWIPYRTSYYRRNWGFCLAHSELIGLQPGNYRVQINTSLSSGSLTYGEFVLPGRMKDEVLLFTHVCHPSLANDNCAGISVATELAKWLAEMPRRLSYRIVFAPGTIGSLCWLKNNQGRLSRIKNGLVLCLLGDPAPLTYKATRRGDCEIDRVAAYVIGGKDLGGRTMNFEPYGYDERQLCSPGFDLPIGRLTRSVNDGYPEYHSSADDLQLIKESAMRESLQACQKIIGVLEDNRRWVNVRPRGEPQLGRRGLYGSLGGRSPAERERTMLWILNQADGGPTLLDIAKRSGIGFDAVAQAAGELAGAGLLRTADERAAKRRALKRRPGTPAKR
jgi:aminopeptidase-like protein